MNSLNEWRKESDFDALKKSGAQGSSCSALVGAIKRCKSEGEAFKGIEMLAGAWGEKALVDKLTQPMMTGLIGMADGMAQNGKDQHGLAELFDSKRNISLISVLGALLEMGADPDGCLPGGRSALVRALDMTWLENFGEQWRMAEAEQLLARSKAPDKSDWLDHAVSTWPNVQAMIRRESAAREARLIKSELSSPNKASAPTPRL
jgi:hypothetical protein